MRTFGEELKHFALTIDIIDETKFKNIFSMVEEYLKQRLHISKCCLLQQRPVQGSIGLHPRYGDLDFEEYGPYKIKDENEQPISLAAYAYDFGSPTWVIPEDEKSDLQSSSKYIELWSNIDTEDFPQYRTVYQGICRTLISVPLVQQSNRFGILFFESEEIIRPVKTLKYELQEISSALGILFLLVDADNLRQNNTREAINNLNLVPRVGSLYNSLFLAYSQNSDPDIVNTIKLILENEFSHIKIIDWSNMYTPGQVITEELVTFIQEAKYAICYLSELDKSTNEYRDNPNVLFESGMIYSLIKRNDTIPQHWIPIREKQSTDVPFDFAGNRILLVERDNGKIKKESFSSELTEMLKNVIDHD